jgi:hypothetical protein
VRLERVSGLVLRELRAMTRDRRRNSFKRAAIHAIFPHIVLQERGGAHEIVEEFLQALMHSRKPPRTSMFYPIHLPVEALLGETGPVSLFTIRALPDIAEF